MKPARRHIRVKRPDTGKVMLFLLCFCAMEFVVLMVLMFMRAISGFAALLATVTSVITVVMSLYLVTLLMKLNAQLDTYEQSADDLESFNDKLRAQRHDFKNHMQVISGLLEMDEYDEAKRYIARVNSDLLRVGRALRTKLPAVNALLEAKRALCQTRGIAMDMDVRAPLDDLPIEGWEFCRVLGNLTDNAIDALAGAEEPELRVSLEDAGGGILLRVCNNGEPVEDSIRSTLFDMGMSTKGEGRGMGLAIVRSICDSCGGSVTFNSSEALTTFEVYLPTPVTAAIGPASGK